MEGFGDSNRSITSVIDESALMTHSLPEDFWERAGNSRRRLLMIDYDGTLAPFHVSRMQARPTEETLAALQEIIRAGHTRVVIVSGRPCQQVRVLLNDLAVDIFGAHGFERSEYAGKIVRSELSNDEISGLEEAKRAAISTGLKKYIEIKPASMAVHVRGLSVQESVEVEELTWNIYTPIAEKYGLECRAFNGGVEIRSRRYHKGIAVDTLLAEGGSETFAVYIGDDDTDEDAFKALASNGIGIKIGGQPSETAAQGHLDQQNDILPFLQQWLKVTSQDTARPTVLHRKSRLVVISNRLPALQTDADGNRTRPIGGLATALEAALSESEAGGLWMGWSGKTSESHTPRRLHEMKGGSVKLIGLDLTGREYEAYYNGFSNTTIWPLFHSFPLLAKLSSWQLEVYRSVNAMFANSLSPSLQEQDLVWVHDYHLMPIGQELRRADWQGRLGFFLHIPFPSLDMLAILPEFRSFLEALMEYDLVGFQTQTYRDNYVYACRRTLGAEWDGHVLSWNGRYQRAGIYPIGIDPRKFLPEFASTDSREAGVSFRRSMGDRDIIIGVDRLDYTKGIPQRALAFEALMQMKPELKGRVSLVQISSPSRTEVPEYMEQKRKMDALAGRINGELGEHDWEPIRYLYRTYKQNELMEFYRHSRVGLVTPLRDGMNLVAKEYVASQNADNPGALVLSRFAGAVEELDEAIIVNPYLPDSTARGIARALEMPLEERQERHQSMLKKIVTQNVQKWAKDFLFDLQAT